MRRTLRSHLPFPRTRSTTLRTNLLRVVWATLPLTTAPTLTACLAPHSSATRNVTYALLAIGWLLALAALAVARPLGLTALRSVAPVAAALAVAAAATGRAVTWAAALAIVATVVAAVLAGSPQVARWSAQGAAYGDEERYPLRVPPSLLVTLVPLALALLAGAVATGPLLLAARQWIAGAVALVVGAPVAAFAVRSLHPLSRRWAVIVPAGFVLHDPMTMSDPTLFVREHVVALRALAAGTAAPSGALDLRLGASRGSTTIHLDGVAPLGLRRRGTVVSGAASEVVFAPALRDDMLEACAARRLPVA